MSTATATEASTSVEANSKVIEALKLQLTSEIATEGLYMTTRNTIVAETLRLGYDRKQAYTMTKLSWRKAKGLKADASEGDIVKFDKDNASAVSNLVMLAFPNEKYAADVEKVIAHNKAHPSKATRVGLIRLHQVCRGQLSADEAINRIQTTRAPRGKTNPNGAVSTAPANERFADAIAGLRQSFLKEENPLSLAEMRKIALAGLADAVATK